jgi:hypothetical protein
MRCSSVVVTGLVVALAACGSQREPDLTLAVTIHSPVEMPFHGPGGPGSEPMYIGFSWTVVVAASGDAESRIGTVRTRLTERTSGSVLTAEGGPAGTLRGGEKVEVAQQTSGLFPSVLYPGDWTGVTTVEVSHGSGRSETLTASFTFR